MNIAEKKQIMSANNVTIAENQQKVFYAGVLSAYQLKGTASGEVVSISDVAPVEHNMAVKLSSKNLFKPTNYTKGTIDANTGGMTSGIGVKEFCLTTDYIYLKSGAYVVSNITGANLRYVAFYNTDKEFKSATWTNRAKTFNFTITEDCYIRIDIERDGSVAIDNFDTFCDEYQFMLEKGTVATSYTPYIADISTVKLDALGKNLIRYPYAETTKTHAGITYTDNGDGSITAKGTATGSSFFRLMTNVDFGLSFGGGSNWSVKGGTNGIYTTNKGLFYNANNKTLTINVANGATVNETLYPQLEVGTTQTSYEPYIEPITYTPYADGTVANVKSIYPTTTLVPSEQGVLTQCEYYQDARKVKQDLTDLIISLGGEI